MTPGLKGFKPCRTPVFKTAAAKQCFYITNFSSQLSMKVALVLIVFLLYLYQAEEWKPHQTFDHNEVSDQTSPVEQQPHAVLVRNAREGAKRRKERREKEKQTKKLNIEKKKKTIKKIKTKGKKKHRNKVKKSETQGKKKYSNKVKKKRILKIRKKKMKKIKTKGKKKHRNKVKKSKTQGKKKHSNKVKGEKMKKVNRLRKKKLINKLRKKNMKKTKKERNKKRSNKVKKKKRGTRYEKNGSKLVKTLGKHHNGTAESTVTCPRTPLNITCNIRPVSSYRIFKGEDFTDSTTGTTKKVQVYDCDMYGYTRDYSIARTQYNRVKRILASIAKLAGYRAFAANGFSAVITMLAASTENGTCCRGSPSQRDNATKIYRELLNCSETGSTYCQNDSCIDVTALRNCEGPLLAYTQKYKKSIFAPGCAFPNTYTQVCHHLGSNWAPMPPVDPAGECDPADTVNCTQSTLGDFVRTPPRTLYGGMNVGGDLLNCLPQQFKELDLYVQAQLATCERVYGCRHGSLGNCTAAKEDAIRYIDLCKACTTPGIVTTEATFRRNLRIKSEKFLAKKINYI